VCREIKQREMRGVKRDITLEKATFEIRVVITYLCVKSNCTILTRKGKFTKNYTELEKLVIAN